MGQCPVLPPSLDDDEYYNWQRHYYYDDVVSLPGAGTGTGTGTGTGKRWEGAAGVEGEGTGKRNGTTTTTTLMPSGNTFAFVARPYDPFVKFLIDPKDVHEAFCRQRRVDRNVHPNDDYNDKYNEEHDETDAEVSAAAAAAAASSSCVLDESRSCSNGCRAPSISLSITPPLSVAGTAALTAVTSASTQIITNRDRYYAPERNVMSGSRSRRSSYADGNDVDASTMTTATTITATTTEFSGTRWEGKHDVVDGISPLTSWNASMTANENAHDVVKPRNDGGDQRNETTSPSCLHQPQSYSCSFAHPGNYQAHAQHQHYHYPNSYPSLSGIMSFGSDNGSFVEKVSDSPIPPFSASTTTPAAAAAAAAFSFAGAATSCSSPAAAAAVVVGNYNDENDNAAGMGGIVGSYYRKYRSKTTSTYHGDGWEEEVVIEGKGALGKAKAGVGGLVGRGAVGWTTTPTTATTAEAAVPYDGVVREEVEAETYPSRTMGPSPHRYVHVTSMPSSRCRCPFGPVVTMCGLGGGEETRATRLMRTNMTTNTSTTTTTTPTNVAEEDGNFSTIPAHAPTLAATEDCGGDTAPVFVPADATSSIQTDAIAATTTLTPSMATAMSAPSAAIVAPPRDAGEKGGKRPPRRHHRDASPIPSETLRLRFSSGGMVRYYREEYYRYYPGCPVPEGFASALVGGLGVGGKMKRFTAADAADAAFPRIGTDLSNYLPPKLVRVESESTASTPDRGERSGGGGGVASDLDQLSPSSSPSSSSSSSLSSSSPSSSRQKQRRRTEVNDEDDLVYSRNAHAGTTGTKKTPRSPRRRMVRTEADGAPFLNLAFVGSLGLVLDRAPATPCHDTSPGGGDGYVPATPAAAAAAAGRKDPNHYLILEDVSSGAALAVCALKSAGTSVEESGAPFLVRIYSTRPRTPLQEPSASASDLGLASMLTGGEDGAGATTTTTSISIYVWAEVVVHNSFPSHRVSYSVYMSTGERAGLFEQHPIYTGMHPATGSPEVAFVAGEGKNDVEGEGVEGCCVISPRPSLSLSPVGAEGRVGSVRRLCRWNDDVSNAAYGSDNYDVDVVAGDVAVSVVRGADPALFLCIAAILDETIEYGMKQKIAREEAKKRKKRQFG